MKHFKVEQFQLWCRVTSTIKPVPTSPKFEPGVHNLGVLFLSTHFMGIDQSHKNCKCGLYPESGRKCATRLPACAASQETQDVGWKTDGTAAALKPKPPSSTDISHALYFLLFANMQILRHTNHCVLIKLSLLSTPHIEVWDQECPLCKITITGQSFLSHC